MRAHGLVGLRHGGLQDLSPASWGGSLVANNGNRVGLPPHHAVSAEPPPLLPYCCFSPPQSARPLGNMALEELCVVLKLLLVTILVVEGIGVEGTKMVSSNVG